MPVVTASPAPAPRTVGHPPWGELPDEVLLAALRDRDEDAYLTLVRRHTPLMLRVARAHVRRREVAEDVVQDTWVAVLRNIDRFEARSTFKTWLMRILVNTARTRRQREARVVCWSSLSSDAPLWDAGLWDAASRDGAEPIGPERLALAGEAWRAIRDALDELPQRQRAVVVLRDVEGWTSAEVQSALGLSAGNQRVLLHRGRIRLRALLAPLAPSARSAPCPQQPELARPEDRLRA